MSAKFVLQAISKTDLSHAAAMLTFPRAAQLHAIHLHFFLFQLIKNFK